MRRHEMGSGLSQSGLSRNNQPEIVIASIFLALVHLWPPFRMPEAKADGIERSDLVESSRVERAKNTGNGK